MISDTTFHEGRYKKLESRDPSKTTEYQRRVMKACGSGGSDPSCLRFAKRLRKATRRARVKEGDNWTIFKACVTMRQEAHAPVRQKNGRLSGHCVGSATNVSAREVSCDVTSDDDRWSKSTSSTCWNIHTRNLQTSKVITSRARRWNDVHWKMLGRRSAVVI